MPAFEILTGSAIGTLFGMRHALEPDHLAAVSTLMTTPSATGDRPRVHAAMLGASWGVGHTLSLVVVGAALVLLRAELPARVADAFELLVAIMLIALGARAIFGVRFRASRVNGHAHRHTHWTSARRPLLVGAVHGLAGSGALTALVLATLSTTAARITYMTLFGVGSTLGMALLSGVLGWPLAKLSANGMTTRALSVAVGCFSIGLGVFWGYRIITSA